MTLASQVIDRVAAKVLHERWSSFLPTGDLHPLTGLEASWLSKWPRRANQALLHSMKTGMPCQTFPLPQTNNLEELQEYASAIAAHEPQLQR
ncbi:MAG: hypothetical protein ACT4NL_12990 [Pseudomarimonas sp.]